MTGGKLALVPDLSVVLIGGTSNVGKSTLAQALASRLGWSSVSTDSLGRHPGRPWIAADRPIPAHVAEHYLSLSIEDLTTEQLRHYRRMWPVIRSLIATHTRVHDAGGLILEGSGVWPDQVAEISDPAVAAIWLTASPATLRGRIYSASRYPELADDGRFLVDKFVGRSNLYNEVMLSAVRRLGLACVDVDDVSSPVALVDQCLRFLDGPGRLG
jgi:2-phosphoglycerate kinase